MLILLQYESHFAYNVVDDTIGVNQVSYNKTANKWIFNYPCATSFQCTPYKVTFPPGEYHMRACGAQGGSTHTNFWANGGFGGCASGEILIPETTNWFLRVGGAGESSDCSTDILIRGGWNGGGSTWGGAAGGGGASDIAHSVSCNARILVGGGGGGANDNSIGGDGGGLIGGPGNISGFGSASVYGYAGGGGGTQTSGGTSPHLPGAFCQGGSHDAPLSSIGGGGGGGYYGGGNGAGNDASGGGGSGFVSGYSGAAVGNIAFSNPVFESGINTGDGFIEITQVRKFTQGKQTTAKLLPLLAHLLLISN